jgi:glycerol-3-phosphate acyltransferase PlsY
MQMGPQDFAPAVSGIAAVVGHNWPVWLGFRGGMGLATGAGAFLPVFWPAVLIGIGLLALFNLIIRRRPRATVFTTLFTPIITLLLRADLASQLLITGACLIIGLKTLGDWNRTDG